MASANTISSTTSTTNSSSTTTTTTTIATTGSSPSRRASPVPSLDLRIHNEEELQQDMGSRRLSRQNDNSTTTTPTAALMRTPPSPRSTVILPLPRVTVTSPSDLCPSSSTVQIESPSPPQTPPSPSLPQPPQPQQQHHHHPGSVVIVPFPTTATVTTTQLVGLNAMEPPPPPPLMPMDMSSLPPPPPYEGFIKDDEGDGIGQGPDGHGFVHLDNLPSYAVATELPTYEEAEIAKANEMRENRDRIHGINGIRVPRTGLQQQQQQHQQQQQQQQDMNYPEGERVPGYNPYHMTGVSLGTDWIFLCTFAISFLFNWLGFLISLCITNTVAGRCGALSGLGLSLVKWVVIMKHNTMAQGFLQGGSWVWWILMICGFLLFLRGCIQYINMKYEWKRIFSRLQQTYFSRTAPY
ncbi:flocculation protein FLO11-like [Argonauta hians]